MGAGMTTDRTLPPAFPRRRRVFGRPIGQILQARDWVGAAGSFTLKHKTIGEWNPAAKVS